MKTVPYPPQDQWPSLCERPTFDFSELNEKVEKIMNKVRKEGDHALIHYAHKFDGAELASISFDLSQEEFNIDQELAKSIKQAKENIERFHHAQKERFQPLETMPGVKCWRKSVPIQNVGLYIPGVLLLFFPLC